MIEMPLPPMPIIDWNIWLKVLLRACEDGVTGFQSILYVDQAWEAADEVVSGRLQLIGDVCVLH